MFFVCSYILLKIVVAWLEQLLYSAECRGLVQLVGTGLSHVCCLVIKGPTGGFSVAPVFQCYCFTHWGHPGITICFCGVLNSDLS